MTLPRAFQRYLTGSVILWSSVGAAHGLALYKLKKDTPDPALRYIVGGTLYGAFLGPWAPVIVPLWLTQKWPMTTCEYLKFQK